MSSLRRFSSSLPKIINSSSSTPFIKSKPTLISPSELFKSIKSYKILDSSYYLPHSNRSALDEFNSLPRLPHSNFFDHDQIANRSYPGGLAHMRPDLDTFLLEMSNLGISTDDHLVFYDSIGIFSSPRAAWLLHSFGHPSISVLDGGLPRWIDEGYPTETGTPSPISPSNYQIIHQEAAAADAQDFVASYEDIIANLQDPQADILDARPGPRFHGTAPEPRLGLPSGHIPGSRSLPFTQLLTQPNKSTQYQCFLKPQELESIFISTLGSHQTWQSIKTGEKGLMLSCGSGMTACVIWMALQICIGTELVKVKVFDESWTGYASRQGSPIIKN